MVKVGMVNFFEKIKFFLPFLIFITAGCAYPPLEEEDIDAPSDYTYKIGPGDTVDVFVWGNPDISKSAVVRPDGKITIPLAEDLTASGKTPSQLARAMEKQLGKYVRDPQVVIMVNGFNGIYAQQVRVIGQLSGGSGGGLGGRGSGGGGLGGGGFGGGGFGGGGFGGGGFGGGGYSAKSFPYKTGMTLLDLMIQIGGLGVYADGNRASIVRKIDGENHQFGIRIDDLINNFNLKANVKILPGDIVIIPEAYF
ncbi:polysaccharide biosynthesis/export family protein [Methylomicrobium sp. RS1]|jgi:polysaccharide export outer membrane protein|uniref:polysaccharide biosynthesis/export family protein n=1 Tax=Candidatus Methylomicrobium oryzae TaxID=2802053 RepID=UPI001924D779|nr:polysaccharide biosynthesis/export family protein [Methylomicrobium sp. RS1]MBL1264962.1 polysaccharide biosynthesis/export family protein [Methylomicrobium sp. RS1]